MKAEDGRVGMTIWRPAWAQPEGFTEQTLLLDEAKILDIRVAPGAVLPTFVVNIAGRKYYRIQVSPADWLPSKREALQMLAKDVHIAVDSQIAVATDALAEANRMHRLEQRVWAELVAEMAK